MQFLYFNNFYSIKSFLTKVNFESIFFETIYARGHPFMVPSQNQISENVIFTRPFDS